MNPGGAGPAVAVLVVSYLLGAMPFGFIAARLRGVDITKEGSGNTGATNVLRTLGPAYALPVALLDIGKGALGAYLGLRYLGMGSMGGLVAGAAAVSGHNWSVFLKFKGGKGVAASAGVILVLFPALLGVAATVFVLVVAATKYVSLGSILGSWTAFFVSLSPGYTLAERVTVLILVCLITFQHRSNIGRLLSGTERKLGQREKGGATR